jgi:hypothetical protein
MGLLPVLSPFFFLQSGVYLQASDAQVVTPSEADLQAAYQFGGYQVRSSLVADRD